MATDVKSEDLVLRVWFLMHRDVGLFRRCEDQMYGERGLTMEQFTILAAIKHIGHPVRPTDIADWIGRSRNTISMMIDRMVKAGLVKRARDRTDRRVINVTATSEAASSFKQAIPVSREFIKRIMSPLSQADRRTLTRLLETIRYETLAYLNPGKDIEAMVLDDDNNHAKIRERLFDDALLSTPYAKRRSGKKRKTMR